MDHQTKMNESQGSPMSAALGLAHDVGEFSSDFISLAELQVQLLATDARECRQNLLPPFLLLIIGSTLAIACFPIGLTSLAFCFIQVFGLSQAVGFLLAALVGMFMSAAILTACWLLVRKRANPFARSHQEFTPNVHWIKKVLQRRRASRSSSNDNTWRTTK